MKNSNEYRELLKHRLLIQSRPIDEANKLELIESDRQMAKFRTETGQISTIGKKWDNCSARAKEVKLPRLKMDELEVRNI